MILGINNEIRGYNNPTFKGTVDKKVYKELNSTVNSSLMQIFDSANEKKQLVDEKLLQEAVNIGNKLKDELKKYMQPFSDNTILTLKYFDCTGRYGFIFKNNYKKDEPYWEYASKLHFGETFDKCIEGVKKLNRIAPNTIQNNMLNFFVKRAEKCAMEGTGKSSNPEALKYVDVVDDIAKALGKKDYMKEKFEPYIKKYKANKIREKELEAQKAKDIESKNEALLEKYIIRENSNS